MNKLATVIAIFNDVQLDVDARNFRKEVVFKHINALNTAFETKIFSSYADPLCGSTWDDLLTPERTSLCSKIINSLLEQKEKLKARAASHQDKMNNTVSLDESLQLFFNRPTPKSWKTLSDLLTARFNDSSLFGDNVKTAFNNWKDKIEGIVDDEISFALNFNFDYRSDFGNFLQLNLKPKNFNYE